MSLNPQVAAVTRIRVRYAKGNALRFIGHLDLQRLWERLLRRSKLPVRYSQGFHPRARLNLASALPLGFISDEELLDFWLDSPCPLTEIQARLVKATPPGLRIHTVQQIDPKEAALQVQMKASEFTVSFYDPPAATELEQKVTWLLTQEVINKTRRKKTYNLRLLVLDMQVINTLAGERGLWMRLLAEPAATGRPDDILEELGFPNTAYLVRRTRVILG